MPYPLYSPAATQTEVEWQATTLSSPTPEGTGWSDQLAPAFVVRSATPASLKAPTASQVLAEGQTRSQTLLTPTNDAICAHERPASAGSFCAASAPGRHMPPMSVTEATPATTAPASLPRRSRSSNAEEPAL